MNEIISPDFSEMNNNKKVKLNNNNKGNKNKNEIIILEI